MCREGLVEKEYELDVTDRRVLEAIPRCIIHGACIPHALEWIEEIAEIGRNLKGLLRQGAEQDTPEGSRYVLISDTLLKKIVATLEGENGTS